MAYVLLRERCCRLTRCERVVPVEGNTRLFSVASPGGSNGPSPPLPRLCRRSLTVEHYDVGSPGISTTGRISTVPRRAIGIRAAMSIASSLSLASIRKYPPSCSRGEWTVDYESLALTHANAHCARRGVQRGGSEILACRMQVVRELRRLQVTLLPLDIVENLLISVNQQHIFHEVVLHAGHARH